MKTEAEAKVDVHQLVAPTLAFSLYPSAFVVSAFSL
jgi:hypothetical protein